MDGECKQVISHIIHEGGLSIMLIVHLKSNWSTIARKPRRVGRLLVKELENVLAVRTCHHCDAIAYIDNSTYSRQDIKIDVLLVKSFTPSCQLDFIHERIEAASQTEIEIPLTRGLRLSATLTVAEKSDFFDDYAQAGRIPIVSGKSKICKVSGYAQKITAPFCPSIQIALSESGELGHGRKKKLFLSFFKNQTYNANATILVCTKDYMTVMRQTSGSDVRQLLESGLGFIVYQILHPFV